MRKNWVEILCFPKWWIVWILFNVSVVLLVYSLSGNAWTIVQYPSYALATYTLFIVVLRLIQLGVRLKRLMYRNAFTYSLISDKEKRFVWGLGISFMTNLLFGLLKMGLGYYYESNWFKALGAYYIVLGMMRVLLFISGRNKENIKKKNVWKIHGACGWMMLIIHLIMTGMVILMLRFNRYFDYPGVLVYVFALYAFYAIGISTWDVIRYWKDYNPILSASKKIQFSCALMSILALQSALLTQFNQDDVYQVWMNTLTATFVCVCILVIAISMIVKARRELQRKEGEKV